MGLLGGVIAGALSGGSQAAGQYAQMQAENQNKIDFAQAAADIENDRQKSLMMWSVLPGPDADHPSYSDLNTRNKFQDAAATRGGDGYTIQPGTEVVMPSYNSAMARVNGTPPPTNTTNSFAGVAPGAAPPGAPGAAPPGAPPGAPPSMVPTAGSASGSVPGAPTSGPPGIPGAPTAPGAPGAPGAFNHGAFSMTTTPQGDVVMSNDGMSRAEAMYARLGIGGSRSGSATEADWEKARVAPKEVMTLNSPVGGPGQESALLLAQYRQEVEHWRQMGADPTAAASRAMQSVAELKSRVEAYQNANKGTPMSGDAAVSAYLKTKQDQAAAAAAATRKPVASPAPAAPAPGPAWHGSSNQKLDPNDTAAVMHAAVDPKDPNHTQALGIIQHMQTQPAQTGRFVDKFNDWRNSVRAEQGDLHDGL